jgi:hypothetical protein
VGDLLLAVHHQPQGYFRAVQQVARDQVHHLARLGGGGLEGVAAGGQVTEERRDLDLGSGGGGVFVQLSFVLKSRQGGPAELLGGPRGEPHPSGLADGPQPLPPKAQGADVLQVGELAGGVVLEGQFQLLPGDAQAVVAHHNFVQPPAPQLDIKPGGACIQGVLEQLPHHVGRP